jgi:ribosome-binding factor A
MRKDYRQGRLGEEIRKIISALLLREIKDPRLSGMVSISAVEVTSDGSYATVYVSIFGDDAKSAEEQENVLTALRSAKGLIKKEIGRQVKLRHIPELIFKPDNSLEYGRHITKIINSLDIKRDDAEEDTYEEN